ncbi:MAG: single-stranded DNA-binding protein [Desulfovibrio sp.]|jgi:single-strand DNA-binding protein|nr:single-stranded DNA-binding protein [Desulfovibrio sp.]MBI4960023.1 single-stranded DNA-binding protein [Desulfovibrio sp.]
MAGSVNKVILVGRLGQDPKLTYLPSGQPAAEFTLATDESFKNREGQKEERTEWHRIKVYGKQAEVCANYLGKGRLVYIEGGLRTRSWEDQQGQKRYTTEIVVSAPGHTVQFMDSKGGGVEAAPGEGAAERRSAPPQQRQQNNRQQREDDHGPAFPSEASGMDDVPF